MSAIDVSGQFPWPVYVLLGAVYVWGLWLLLAPDRVWRLMRPFVVWQYRDGDRLELSTAGRVRSGFGGIVAIVLSLGIGLGSINWTAESRVNREREGFNTIYYLGDPVESPGCTVRIVACLRSDEVFPIELTGYDEFGSVADGPGYLSELESLPASTNLLLFVADRFFPTHLVVFEDSGRVTVSLYGRCKPRRLTSGGTYGDSASDCRGGSPGEHMSRGIVPATLDSGPPAGRMVIDGSRSKPVDRADR